MKNLISDHFVSNTAVSKQNIVGSILLLALYLLMGFLIYGYAHIASSTMPNNFLKVAYEPSGLQMLYFVFALPFFMVCAIFIISIGKLCKKSKKLALFPLITGVVFFCFIETIDRVVTFPTGNNLFYYGSLTLSLIFLITTILLILAEIRFLIAALKS